MREKKYSTQSSRRSQSRKKRADKRENGRMNAHNSILKDSRLRTEIRFIRGSAARRREAGWEAGCPEAEADRWSKECRHKEGFPDDENRARAGQVYRGRW